MDWKSFGYPLFQNDDVETICISFHTLEKDVDFAEGGAGHYYYYFKIMDWKSFSYPLFQNHGGPNDLAIHYLKIMDWK